MPTISQLPSATAISAADEMPISQDGLARAISVGALFAAAQPVIIVDSRSLLGRSSLGPGSPEQVNIGVGVCLTDGTLVADGVDHATFPLTSSLPAESDLVISDQGRPGLMPASLMRGLFSAGANVAIDPNGVISANSMVAGNGTPASGSSISELQVVTGLAAQDLIAVSHSGSNSAIAYSNLLGGVTIDQAQTASPVGDIDRIWVAQGTNIMVAQNFSSIWLWVANKFPAYRAPIVEVTVDTNLDVTVHNGRILICSQPVILTPLVGNMGAGFQCTVINASTGIVTLGSSFISSSGSLMLSVWQSAVLSCIVYSGGTIAYADMRAAVLGTSAAPTQPTVPVQVTGLSAITVSSSAIQLNWSVQNGAAAATSFTVQYKATGSSVWTSSVTGIIGSGKIISGLQAAVSYDFTIIGVNSAGGGPGSAVVTAFTLTALGSANIITWNLLPAGSYPLAGGTIGVNARVEPATSAIQFGFSLSLTIPPSIWAAATHINADLWGAYVPTPAAAGTWYAWAEGLDGSAPTVGSGSFLVQ